MSARRPKSVTVEHRGHKVTATAHRAPIRSSPHWAWRAQLNRSNILSARMPRGEVSAALIAAIDAELGDGTEEEVEAREPLAGEVLDWWCASCDRNPDIRPQTKRACRAAAQALIAVVGDQPISVTVSPAGLETAAIELRQTYARSTTWAYLCRLRTAYLWGQRHAPGMPDTPFELPAGYRGRKVATREPVYNTHEPTPAELWRAIDATEGKDARAWQLVFYIMGATGARVGEVGNLLAANVNPTTGAMRVHSTHGNKTGERWLALPQDSAQFWRPRLREALARRSTHPDRAGKLFGFLPSSFTASARNRLFRACEAAGVPPFPPKSLRLMVSNALFDAGADPAVEAMVLGHSEETAALHYRRASARRAAEVLAASGIGLRPELPAAEGEHGGAKVIQLKR